MYKSVNESLSISSLFIYAAICLLTCISLFWIAEASSVVKMVEYSLFLSAGVLVLYFYLSNGQRVVDESENMRRALFACNWVDKPKWFKTSILLMMIRSAKTLELKPFGLNHFSMTVDTFVADSKFNQQRNSRCIASSTMFNNRICLFVCVFYRKENQLNIKVSRSTLLCSFVLYNIFI
ncbi:odorant receptor 67a-like [Lycorma delicatula]|uniref:odorant receptor 67a-like n=1 Tax=Lycorma delicatula TaxID=130591 RepID=UPI003F510686